MSNQTLADRIMAAADLWAHKTGSLWTDEEAAQARATLVALVAEACAPPPERVCRCSLPAIPEGSAGAVDNE